MGCIVNGVGEMADADFGYVGGAPGKVRIRQRVHRFMVSPYRAGSAQGTPQTVYSYVWPKSAGGLVRGQRDGAKGHPQRGGMRRPDRAHQIE